MTRKVAMKKAEIAEEAVSILEDNFDRFLDSPSHEAAWKIYNDACEAVDLSEEADEAANESGSEVALAIANRAYFQAQKYVCEADELLKAHPPEEQEKQKEVTHG
jgi:hypothetical protein